MSRRHGGVPDPVAVEIRIKRLGGIVWPWLWTIVWVIPAGALPGGEFETTGCSGSRKAALRSAHREIRRVANRDSSVEVIPLEEI